MRSGAGRGSGAGFRLPGVRWRARFRRDRRRQREHTDRGTPSGPDRGTSVRAGRGIPLGPGDRRMARAQRRTGPPGRARGCTARPQFRRGAHAQPAVRPEQVRLREGRVPLARVHPPVRRPDAGRLAGGRHRQPVPAEGTGHRPLAAAADRVQRGAPLAAGGEGRGGGGRAAADDDQGWATASPRPASWSGNRAGRTGRYSPGA